MYGAYGMVCGGRRCMSCADSTSCVYILFASEHLSVFVVHALLHASAIALHRNPAPVDIDLANTARIGLGRSSLRLYGTRRSIMTMNRSCCAMCRQLHKVVGRQTLEGWFDGCLRRDSL